MKTTSQVRVECIGSGQLCDARLSVGFIPDASSASMRFTPGPEQCCPFRLRIRVNGGPLIFSSYCGWAGAPRCQVLPLSVQTALGSVIAGDVNELEIEAEGMAGGCNSG